MNIKPIDDRLLIEQVEAESTTAGGIIIPDTAKEKPMQGDVVAGVASIVVVIVFSTVETVTVVPLAVDIEVVDVV